eukprot:11544837-Prorocentrum_lima.AAC.1
MTSSLVGSEMCIRDSFRCWYSAPGRCGPSTFSLNSARSLSMSASPSVAVSYTHLTLPTICSV